MASGSIEEPDLCLLFGDLRSGHVLGGGRWRPSVRSGARSGDRHDQDGHRRVGLGSTPSLEGDGVTGGWCRNPSVSRRGKMETFGQIACSVRRPARSYLFRYGHSRSSEVEPGGWVGFHPLFRGGRCNRGVVPLPIRFTARKDGDLRSDRVLGRETTHPFHGGHRRHDQKFHGEERWRPSVRSRARSGDYPSISRWLRWHDQDEDKHIPHGRKARTDRGE